MEVAFMEGVFFFFRLHCMKQGSYRGVRSTKRVVRLSDYLILRLRVTYSLLLLLPLSC